jgi:hypothetical protein
MSTIRQDIERERELRKQRQPDRVYKPDGLRAVEDTGGTEIFYCPVCKGPVVDSARAREKHKQDSKRCGRTA